MLSEPGEIPVYLRATGEYVGSDDISGPSDHWSTWAVTPKLEEWPQQIPEPAFTISLQKREHYRK